jgi:hypothetical protein
MKAAATLLALILASCAIDTAPDTSTTEEHATVINQGLPQVSTSCQWIPGKTCYGLPNDGDNIWPANIGITRVQVLTRGGPTRMDGERRTTLAFVVWNGIVVGRIFRIDTDMPEYADFRAKLDDIVAGRAMTIRNGQEGSNGNPVANPNPPPHPNVNQGIVFDLGYLDVVKRYANVIDNATDGFLGTKIPGVDQ